MPFEVNDDGHILDVMQKINVWHEHDDDEHILHDILIWLYVVVHFLEKYEIDDVDSAPHHFAFLIQFHDDDDDDRIDVDDIALDEIDERHDVMLEIIDDDEVDDDVIQIDEIDVNE